MMNFKGFGRKWSGHKKVLSWYFRGETEEERVTSVWVIDVLAKYHTKETVLQV
jgi:hypothetical protein